MIDFHEIGVPAEPPVPPKVCARCRYFLGSPPPVKNPAPFGYCRHAWSKMQGDSDAMPIQVPAIVALDSSCDLFKE